jgi:single-strand DNA-binding protein
MASLNEVTLIGNVGKDVEVKVFDNGGKIAKFTMATTESYKRKDGEKVENTAWHNVVIRSEPLVNIAERYVGKGSSVCVKGKVYYREYEKEGEKRKLTEIVLDPYQGQLILLSRKENKQQSLGDYDKTVGINI